MPSYESSLISVVIPAYNEEKRIGYTLREIKEYFEKKRWKGEIIVVDDGSTDHTLEVVEEKKKDIPNLFLLKNEKNEGKGEAVKKGMLSAKGDWVFFSDADLSTPIEEMDKLLSFLKEGWEVVIASRALPGAEVFPRQPFFRELSGKIFNLMVRILLLPGIRDTQCGFKGFSREAARKIFSLQTLKGFAFDVEILYIGR
ncbi:MAG TPA: glycosyltransferase family 2 protein, partial [bacterium]|nr:glycosyltransferase family 2 protein [bacterium]HEX67944.1 glycosyltransferase family 2 protein [bacterium]